MEKKVEDLLVTGLRAGYRKCVLQEQYNSDVSEVLYTRPILKNPGL